ncbi:hypothetical protein [Congregibacter litoralis]|uniref:Uncharacterized protein n=1 Tax=Congregibacter litoralis KT71 TaxID=314285 RepID=A4A952_9GAMM|nr:hypothetical protein [Congregibacter litoralis]EAQ97594.1 hypothetical protein KT71_04775 [Congregibacter litoralis KT71]
MALSAVLLLSLIKSSFAMSLFFRSITFGIFPALFFTTLISVGAYAQEGFDDEEVVVYLKKIRDEESNYLREVTKATARAVSKSGEFIARPHKRNSSGLVIEVEPPAFSFEPHKEGMSTKEMATAGLSLVSDVGSIFGFGKEASKATEVNARLNQNNAILDNWGDDEQVMVSMLSRVLLTDEESGVEITRTISHEQVFDSKSEFLEQKDALLEGAIVVEVKKALVEYLDDSGF